nr:protein of unknown function (DUF1049) [uncultured bacterium]
MKRQPFLTLILIIMLCSFLGSCGSLFFFSRYEAQARREARAKGWGEPTEIGDAIPFFLLVGTTIGFFTGVAAGSFWYVKVKASEKEIQHII